MKRTAALLGLLLLLGAWALAQEEPAPPKNMVPIASGEVRIETAWGARIVKVEAFFLDLTEVTNAAYATCVDAGVCKRFRKKTVPNVDADALPVVDVSPFDAQTYCRWVNKHLPTHEQWVRAAGESSPQQLYPWGNGDPYHRANYAETALKKDDRRIWRFAHPVCSHPMGNTPSGLCDLAGNVAEWVVLGPQDAQPGGHSYGSMGGGFLSTSDRLQINVAPQKVHVLARSFDAGFRCAKDEP